MISKYAMKKYIIKYSESLPFVYKEEEDAIYDRDGTYMSSLDEFLDIYRKHSGESFENIYYDHVSLQDVIRCTECGTVIFSSEDELFYDPNLKCPTCTGYHTRLKYWTKEDIESDEEKQNVINLLKEEMHAKEEMYKRIERRNGKYDWEIAVKKIYGKKIFLEFDLECDNITKSYLKGLRLEIRIGKRENKDSSSYTVTKHFTIPLSWSSFYIRFIYPHLGKCPSWHRSKYYVGKAVETKK